MKTIQEIIKAKQASYKYFTEKDAIEAVKKNGYDLVYIKEQTETICIEAVKQDGYALAYVKNQTEAICTEAVKQDGNALAYVKNQTEAICIEAFKQDKDASRFFNESLFIVAPKELTIEELSVLLGYEVKIIK